MTPTPAPMTAGEAHAKSIKHAVSLLCGAYDTWMDDRTEHHARTVIYSHNAVNNAVDAMAAHWPAGGAVTALTGQAMYEAHGWTFNAGYADEWESLEQHTQENWNRAAARLSAPPVVVDVDDTAVQVGMSAYKTGYRDGEKAAQKAMDADSLAQEIMAYVYPPSGDLSATKANIAAILRRHAAAPATAQVVEVTANDLLTARAEAGKHKMHEFPTFDHVIAWELTRMLRARATTAGQTTGAQWVRRPEGQASTLVVPAGVRYAWRAGTMWSDAFPPQREPVELEDGCDGYRIINNDWTSGPVIERTPATAGGWTEDTVPPFGAAFWCVLDNGQKCGCIRVPDGHSLNWFNRRVTTWCPVILPSVPVEAQP